MELQEIPYTSHWYEQVRTLRNEVLRKPIGLILSDKDVEGEDQQIHIAAIQQGQVVGSVILKPLSSDIMKLRQMAVAASQQGKGLGSAIVTFAEGVAISRHFKIMELHARVSAQRFYEKLGYVTAGDVFSEVGLPTIKMYKGLYSF